MRGAPDPGLNAIREHKDRKKFAAALKPIYTAANAKAARAEFDTFRDGPWGKKYPHAVATWEAAWERFIPFLAFPPELRRVIYTTNSIENVLKRFRFRAYPTVEQKKSLGQLFGCTRVAYNDAIAAREAAFRNGEPFLSSAVLSHRLTVGSSRPWNGCIGSTPNGLTSRSMTSHQNSSSNSTTIQKMVWPEPAETTNQASRNTGGSVFGYLCGGFAGVDESLGVLDLAGSVLLFASAEVFFRLRVVC